MLFLSRAKCFGPAAKVAVCRGHNAITSAARRVTRLLSPLYPIVKWFAVSVVSVLLLNLAATYIAEDFDLPFLKRLKESTVANPKPIVLAMGSFVLFLAWIGHREKENRRRLKAAFHICTPAEELTLADLGFRHTGPQEPDPQGVPFQERPFFGTYFPRKAKALQNVPSTDQDPDMKYAENYLEDLIRTGGRFLLVDAPLAGKTMTLYQILLRMKGYTVVSPKVDEKIPDADTFQLLKGRQVVILLDNLSTFLSYNYNLQGFTELIGKVTNNRYAVAASCRDGAMP